MLRAVSDTAWWRLLANHFGKKVVRLPTIIGNYHSHPAEQAEFRSLAIGDDELRLIEELGVRLL